MKGCSCCAIFCAVALQAFVLQAQDAAAPSAMGPVVAPLTRANESKSGALDYYAAPAEQPVVVQARPAAPATLPAPTTANPLRTSNPGGMTVPPTQYPASAWQPATPNITVNAAAEQSAGPRYSQLSAAVQTHNSDSTSIAPFDAANKSPPPQNDKPGETTSRWQSVQAAFRQMVDPPSDAPPSGPNLGALPAPVAPNPAPSSVNAPASVPSVRVEPWSNSGTPPSVEPASADARAYLPNENVVMNLPAPGCPQCSANGPSAAAAGNPRDCSCILQRLACCLCSPYPDCGNGCVDICHSWIFNEDKCWLSSNHKCCQPGCPPSPYGGCATDGASSGCGCGGGGNTGPCVPPPDIYFTAEALTLTRDNRSVPQTVVDQSGTPVLSTGEFPFDWEAGPKFVLGYRPTKCDAWEITYFGLFDWDSHQSVTGAANLNLPGDVGALTGFNSADIVNATYSSNVNNGEFNYLWNHGCCVTYLIGFRYFQLDEHFDVNAIELPSSSNDYDIHTVNNMYGGQIGLRSGGHWRRFGWDVTAKAGAFGNAIRDEQKITDSTGAELRDVVFQQGHWAFVGDLGLNASYQICKYWSVRAGYDLLWVNGVAFAPDQLDFTNTAASGTTLNHNGSIFFQGINAGFAFRW